MDNCTPHTVIIRACHFQQAIETCQFQQVMMKTCHSQQGCHFKQGIMTYQLHQVNKACHFEQVTRTCCICRVIKMCQLQQNIRTSELQRLVRFSQVTDSTVTSIGHSKRLHPPASQGLCVFTTTTSNFAPTNITVTSDMARYTTRSSISVDNNGNNVLHNVSNDVSNTIHDDNNDDNYTSNNVSNTIISAYHTVKNNTPNTIHVVNAKTPVDNVNDNSDSTGVPVRRIKNGALRLSRKRQLRGDVSHLWSFRSPLGMLRLLVLVIMLLPHSAGGNVMDVLCSSICVHGTCSFPGNYGKGENPEHQGVVCRCAEGWGGRHCTVPCSLRCGSGQCVFVGRQQLCLCALGLHHHNCSHTPFGFTTLISLARLVDNRFEKVHNLHDSSIPKSPPLPFSFASSSTSSSNKSVSLPGGQKETDRPSAAPGFSSEVQTPLPATTPLPNGSMASPPPVHSQMNSPQTSPPPSFLTSTTSSGTTGISEEMRRFLLVALVTNPRDLIEQNVQKGASQCTPNFVCQHGGRCVVGRYGGFRCQCKAPFFGTFCEHRCPRPCVNGARCVRVRQREAHQPDNWTAANFVFRCLCPPGFTGLQCQTPTMN